ncbi:alpha/beta fold hydrolase [Rhodococcus sp. ABRD24]|uniref:esterase/lipase family protein n=1 Tax=Rhodococcus sp. ABRD24 TaxID=2507582 RepID=UPI00103A3C36|nr:alpha/beta fold hydrolase [Rhodococcus sp. ABRD24]QBJ95940.1 alpha/beta fold hydrolase [Rhodococcus sp. ABRD24]
MRKLFAGIVSAVSGALLISAGGTASAAPLPVPDGFFAGILPELTNPAGSLPGSNDFSCKPTAEHPEPVILVHGTGGGQQTNWGKYAPMLANEGYCVFSLTYGNVPGTPWPVSAIGGMRPMEESARQFGDFVDRVLASTGAAKVNIVGHSQGTLMPSYYLKFLGGADKVDKYVSLAPLWQGIATPGVAEMQALVKRLGLEQAWEETVEKLCGACFQMAADSEFMTKLNEGGPYVPQVTYTNIMTRYDEAIVPYTRGYVPAPNATNIVVQDGCALDFAEHAGIAADPIAATHVLNALDPAHPRPIPCFFVPPFTG